MEAILIAPEKFDSLQELKRLGLVLSNNELVVSGTYSQAY